jgi:3-oxoacyl-[acyl-carrier protein] reductase
VAHTALGRLGRPEDIAAVVAFLAGPDSGWISGQNIGADGGLLP